MCAGLTLSRVPLLTQPAASAPAPQLPNLYPNLSGYCEVLVDPPEVYVAVPESRAQGQANRTRSLLERAKHAWPISFAFVGTMSLFGALAVLFLLLVAPQRHDCLVFYSVLVRYLQIMFLICIAH